MYGFGDAPSKGCSPITCGGCDSDAGFSRERHPPKWVCNNCEFEREYTPILEAAREDFDNTGKFRHLSNSVFGTKFGVEYYCTFCGAKVEKNHKNCHRCRMPFTGGGHYTPWIIQGRSKHSGDWGF
jgi:hypothetical protein